MDASSFDLRASSIDALVASRRLHVRHGTQKGVIANKMYVYQRVSRLSCPSKGGAGNLSETEDEDTEADE